MKRMISLALALIMLLCGIYVPVSAADDVVVSTNFDNYTGTWNGTTVVTGGTLPTVAGVSRVKAETMSAYQGVTSGAPSGSPYGTSVKIVQKPNANDASNTYTYLSFDGVNKTGSVYMGNSVYIAKSETGKYTSRSIRWNVQGNVIYPIDFSSGGSISTFGAGTGVKWAPDTWYDVKIWCNLETGAYQVQLFNGAAKLVDKVGVVTAPVKLSNVLYWYSHYSKHATLAAAGEQVTYFDNLKIENIYKFSIDETAALTHFDFNEWDTAAGKPSTLGVGKWDVGLIGGGANTHPVEQIATDRGYSLKISAKTTDNYSGLATTAEKYDVSNPSMNFDSTTKITTAAGFKTSFMFPDNNFNNFQLKMSNDILVLQALSDASITTFDGIDTEMDVKLDIWYDFAVVLDYDTGYYEMSLSNADGEYFEHSGFSKQTIKATAANLYRTWFRLNGRWNDDYTLPTAIIIDDFYYGAVSKMNAPLYGGYDFADGKMPSVFTATGGTAAVTGGELKITGATDAETKVSQKLPFKNTNFRYLADITLSDLTADRTLSAKASTGTVEVLKLGADGKLYIGGTEVADVTVSTGTYNVKAVFDRTKTTATVSVSKNGTVIATGNVTLISGNVVNASMVWSVGAGTTTTSLDNIEYRGIYKFLLDNNASTTGADKEIKLSDAVIAKFSNAVDKTTFNATTVSVNGGEIATAISFPDDNTVKFDFEKLPGETYRVNMTGVKDLFGNSVTDYIQFSVEDEDNLYLTEVQFTQNGSVAEKTAPGTITAAFDAAAYAEDVDILFAVAAYESGKLADCRIDMFTVSDTIQNHSLSLNIPDDGKYYILKAFIWDSETFEPYAETKVLKASTLPILIIKLDGVGVGERLTPFIPCYEYAIANDVKMSLGVIARDLETSATKDILKLDEMENHETIEFWNHQYAAGNMEGWTQEEIMADFENVKRASESTGVECLEVFESIQDHSSPEIVNALNAYNYKVCYNYRNESWIAHNNYFDEDNTFRMIWRNMQTQANVSGTNPDGKRVSGVLPMQVKDAIALWEDVKFKGWDYVSIQYHPKNWATTDITTDEGVVYSTNDMYRFVDYLREEGVIFMTAMEYVEYSSVLHPVR